MTGWVYWFAGPRSYTGEDLVEFHVPGSPLLGRMLLDEIVRRGARLAEAGEFTARAYFNGRMDLTQAEGVAATIAAQSERELRAARQLLAGELARRLTPVMDGVAQALALVEVGIDFSDEDVTFLSAAEVRERCTAAIGVLEGILAESARFERLSHEPRIVLVGRPNAGKSTLLNALAGRQRAVVSNIAGTTRDAIWAEVRLARGMVRVVDVAGVEEVGSGQSAVGSEEEGIARQMHAQAMREVGEADLVILVREALCSFGSIELERKADLVIRTKVDLTDAAKRHPELAKDLAGSQMASNSAEILQSSKLPQDDGAWETQETVVVSAETGVGLDALRARLDALAFGADVGGGGLALNARHVRAIGEARDALGRAVDAVDHGAEVVAMELREALESLGSVLGRMSPDDLLGRIFSAFCIGK
ncbi:MAG: trmE [Phycisphaerales bacterium]|nr:trmE [Phycisphaerales bacterium]